MTLISMTNINEIFMWLILQEVRIFLFVTPKKKRVRYESRRLKREIKTKGKWEFGKEG